MSEKKPKTLFEYLQGATPEQIQEFGEACYSHGSGMDFEKSIHTFADGSMEEKILIEGTGFLYTSFFLSRDGLFDERDDSMVVISLRGLFAFCKERGLEI